MIIATTIIIEVEEPFFLSFCGTVCWRIALMSLHISQILKNRMICKTAAIKLIIEITVAILIYYLIVYLLALGCICARHPYAPLAF